MDTLSALFSVILFVATIVGAIKLLGLWNILDAQKKDAESWRFIAWDEQSLSDIHRKLVEIIASGKRKPQYFQTLEAIEAAIAMRTRLGIKENVSRTSKDSTSAHQMELEPSKNHSNINNHERAAEFFDYDGIPVSLGNLGDAPLYCAAWDVVPPRVFDPGSARRNGSPVSLGAFIASLSPDVLDFALSTLLSAGLISPAEARVAAAIEKFKKDTAGKTWEDLAREQEAHLGKPSV